jgi:hypothetical protein
MGLQGTINPESLGCIGMPLQRITGFAESGGAGLEEAVEGGCLSLSNILVRREIVLKKRAKILIIEDSENVRKSYGDLLTHEGYDTLEAGQGEEALKIIKNRRPDLILLDLLLPEVDGEENKTCSGRLKWTKSHCSFWKGYVMPLDQRVSRKSL